jgi:hypothetical protein
MLRDRRAGGEVFKRKRVISELTSRKRRMRSDGRYELEPKHEAQKRGARSPDWGDAIAMCFAPRPKGGPVAFIESYFARAGQWQDEPAAPTKYTLNRQTGAVELMAKTKAAAATEPAPGTPRRKTPFEVYLHARKSYEERMLRYGHSEVCGTCDQPIAQTDHYVTDGINLWHSTCA